MRHEGDEEYFETPLDEWDNMEFQSFKIKSPITQKKKWCWIINQVVEIKGKFISSAPKFNDYKLYGALYFKIIII